MLQRRRILETVNNIMNFSFYIYIVFVVIHSSSCFFTLSEDFVTFLYSCITLLQRFVFFGSVLEIFIILIVSVANRDFCFRMLVSSILRIVISVLTVIAVSTEVLLSVRGLEVKL